MCVSINNICQLRRNKIEVQLQLHFDWLCTPGKQHEGMITLSMLKVLDP